MRPTLVALLLCTGIGLADERPWTDLLANDRLDGFRGKTTNWKFVKAVTLDPKKPGRFLLEEGSGVAVNGDKGNAADLYTKDKFGDHEVHIEFCIPKGSNSGIKFHGLYEIQICDSHGKKELTGDDCGGIYPRAELSPRYRYLDKGVAPKVNACKAPGEWQTLEAIFIAPRFGADGKKTAPARLVKATLNGLVIHENQVLNTPTGHNYVKPEMAEGPLMLQGDHGPVAFRSVKVRPK